MRKTVLIGLLAIGIAASARAADPQVPAQSAPTPQTEVLGRMSDTTTDNATDSPVDPADAAWIAWTRCDGNNGCADAPATKLLQQQEPDNAALWMPDVAAAQTANESKRIDAALQRMARASRYDDHIYTIARAAALRALPPQAGPADFARAIRAFLAGAGVTPSSLYAVMRSCREAPQSDRARRISCLRSGSTMENGGSLLGQMAGQMLIVHASDNLAERAATAQREREREWQMQQMAALSKSMVDDPSLAKGWLHAIRTHTSETGMVAALLTARSIALQPPSAGQ
ncbi:MAG: hypothetical protein ABIY40_00640 [Rhodanobacteraceae bacterium]